MDQRNDSPQQRLTLLELLLVWEGRIYRSRVCELFGIGLPRASQWIKEIRDLNPTWMQWDSKSRSYFATPDFYKRYGTAKSWLIGDMAQKLKNDTKAPPNTRVKASVTTVQVIRPGCKRLRLVLGMPTHKMRTVNGTMEPFSMFYELNLCRDGQPPQVSPVGMGEAR